MVLLLIPGGPTNVTMIPLWNPPDLNFGVDLLAKLCELRTPLFFLFLFLFFSFKKIDRLINRPDFKISKLLIF
ncbi:hypothetical protein EUGRSUZ_I01051 [Eucalyptus grandis]|uniref:Uncharacterized protein n=2 Tax=Eucalyptus grandis TaxID=71139 RepID=A0ACC3JGJ8_EUCGR|nr:hypothetical protein EUGRSUZ_I01051 [Eucalyptus grandis]